MVVAADEHRGAALLFEFGGRRRKVLRQQQLVVVDKCATSDQHGAAVDLGLHPVAGEAGERRGGRNLQPQLARGRDDRRADGVLGARLDRGRSAAPDWAGAACRQSHR